MIGKLSGIVDSIAGNKIVLDVQGVGYLVSASARTLSRLQKSEPASLLIETQVREDAITLFGFFDVAEQEWFRLLTSVQGVGPKAGLAILSACPPDKLGFAIAAQDKAALTQAEGVGPKLAMRILTELKDKAGQIDLAPARGKKYSEIAESAGIEQDAVSALINLGYARGDAYAAVMNAKQKANDNLQILIREALRELSA